MPGQTPQALDPYIRETLALLGDRDPLQSMAEMPGWLTAHLDDLPETALYQHEAPGKWSITEVLAHLADTEMVFGWRVRLVLTADRPPITGYDQESWASKFEYADADPAQAFHAFAMSREWNLATFRTIGPNDLTRVGIHSERGEESVARILALLAGHDLRHRRQIERIIESLG